MKKFIPSLVSAFFLSGAAFAAHASSEDPLTIYTYDSFAADWGPGPKVEKAFEANCNCDIEFVSLEDGAALLNRLRIEGSTTKADIVLGLDTNLMEEARRSNIVVPHDIKLDHLTVPGGWEDDTFIPYDYGYFAFVYDKTRLLSPPTSLKELIEDRDDIKVIYQDPRVSTVGQGLMLWMKSVYGDDAADAWKKLSNNTLTVTKGWTEAYNMFLEGEADMVLSYTTSPAYHLIVDGDDRYATANFDEGHYMQIEVAAKVAASDQQALAERFLQFMVTDAFQNIIPTTQWMYPVVDVKLPKGFNTLSLPKETLLFKPQEVAEKRKAWIREWQTALVE